MLRFLTLFVAFCAAVCSQSVSGTFVGVVTDSSQAVVPNAQVEITDVQRGIVKKVSASADGTFTAPYMQPSEYRVRVTAPGFKVFERSGITLQLGTTVRVEATLQLGQLSDSVTVSSTSALLQTDRAAVEHSIDTKAIADLPNLGRNYKSDLLLLPGAGIPANYWSPENAYNGSNGRGDTDTTMNGTPATANNYLMDGILNKENMLNNTLVLPPPEAIGEIQVTTSNYDAESGTAGGALVNVTTRGGTNQFHGNLSEYHTDSGLGAKNVYAIRKPRQTRNQYVGTVGGPIQHDKTFFFADFSGNNMRIGRSGALFTMPSDAYRRGDFSAARFPIYDPATGNPNGSGRQQFPGNIIPANRLSPVSLNLVKILPQPINSSPTNNYVASTLFGLDSYNTDIRVDRHFGANTSVFVKYSYFQFNDSDPGIFGDYGGPTGSNAGQVNISHGRNQGLSLNGTHSFSPSLIMEARLGFAREFSDTNSPGWDKKTAEALGIAGVFNGDLHLTGGMPTMNLAASGFPNIGPVPALPITQINETFNVVNSWTKIHGRHTFKWGTDDRKLRGDYLQGNSGSRGNVVFATSVTGTKGGPATDFSNAWASFMLGLPDFIQRSIPLTWPTSIGYQFTFFGQDTWQVSSKLTLNIGVRYELWSAPGSRNPGGQANYQPQNNTVLIAGLGSVPLSAGVQWDKNNWAPRIGFAYRPAQKTVIRGGYGLSYFTNTYGFYGGTLGGMYPSVINKQYGDANDYLPEGNINFVPMPVGPPVPSNGIMPAPDLTYWYIPNNNNFPYIASWNFTVQRALPGDISLEAGYVGNRGFHMPVQVDVNQSGPGQGAAGKLLYRAFGRTSPTPCRCNDKDSNYNALQVLAKRQFHNGLYFQLAYTYSRALDDMQISSFWAPPGFDYGPTAGMAAHTMVLSHVWELPFGPGKKFATRGVMSHIIGNWSLNGILVAKTGNWMGVTADAAPLGAVGAANRPNVVKAVTYTGQVGPGTHWFDPSAFQRPAALTFGNAGKNILAGPGLIDYDASIFRTFRFTERWNLQFRGEFYNLTNTPHFNNPNATLESPVFGTVNSAYGERRVQLGVRLQF